MVFVQMTQKQFNILQAVTEKTLNFGNMNFKTTTKNNKAWRRKEL